MSSADAVDASGWNCVPKANQSGIVLSIASTMPSGQRAVTSKPGATSSTAMWCMLLTRSSPSP